MKLYNYPYPFRLESGAVLHGLTIAYHTFGTLDKEGDNVVWICHGLTANSDIADWWSHALDPGAFADPKTHFTVCANLLGSHYGTTGPLSTNPQTGQPYYSDFPHITIRDMARVNSLLADMLGLNHIGILIGASVGGFQALEWAASEPRRFGKLVLIATAAKASPWSIALDETQRMAIKADPTFGLPSPDAGRAGMAAARAIGLLSYRGPYAYNLTQQDNGEVPPAGLHRAMTYQQYQGEKLCRRFNAYSYMAILNAFDTHDLGRGRGSLGSVLHSLRLPALVVGIDSDIIFTPTEMRSLAEALPSSEFQEIKSLMGHDGFLTEHEALNSIIKPFIDNDRNY